MAVTLNASTSSGFIATSDTSGNLELQANGTTKATVGSTGLSIGQYNPSASLLTSATAQNSTSGTSIDFTGIPSWVKRITIMFNAVSTNGGSFTIIQVGSGSFTTSGYTANRLGFVAGGGTFNTTGTTGFFLGSDGAAQSVLGHVVLTNVSGNTWVQSSVLSITTLTAIFNTGTVTLSGVLDRLRITTQNGTDTFDAGSINIFYE